MKPILIISATRGKKEDTVLYKSLQYQDNNRYKLDMYEDNEQGLSTIYNNTLKTVSELEYDYILFVHDDVSLQDSMFQFKIYESMKQFDVVGFAGTTKCVIKKPALWHIMNNDKPFHGASGAVAHPNDQGIVRMSTYGDFGTRCILLDGLFLAVNIKKVKETGLLFDEQFKFHFYDLDLCLTANKKKLKMGTAPIWVIHKSAGLLNYNDKGFQQLEDKFVNKWKGNK